MTALRLLGRWWRLRPDGDRPALAARIDQIGRQPERARVDLDTKDLFRAQVCRQLVEAAEGEARPIEPEARDALAAAEFHRDRPPALHVPVSYTHLRAHETPEHLVCR